MEAEAPRVFAARGHSRAAHARSAVLGQPLPTLVPRCSSCTLPYASQTVPSSLVDS